MRSGSQDPIREPLGAALEVEVRRIDLWIARVWQVLALICVGLALWFAAVVSRAIGFSFAVVSLVFVGWFSLVHWLLQHQRGGRWLPFVSTVVESSMPWIGLMLLTVAQGAAYALGSWVPPLVFAGLIVAATARLRPMMPLVVGISGAAAFALLHFLAVRSALPPAVAAQPLYRDETQLTRAVALIISGSVGALLAHGLRKVIARAESTVRAQDLFGKYRLVRKVASGGMGTIHDALYCPEGGFERRVAIKRIHPHLAEQQSFVQAFRHEAELCARLVHANVVQVFDFGRVEDTYFIAMEYVDGMTLLTFMRRMHAESRSLPVPLVAHVVREVLAGLTYSHTGARATDGKLLRVIHRDLSPANILLSRTGEVKISDFGIARALQDAASGSTQSMAGHIGYMAPEQAQGLAFDERSDLFALGVVLWELLAGERLFQRENQTASLLALVTASIPLISSKRDALDPAWNELLQRALARSVDERFASASEMATDLDRLAPPGGRRDAEELGAWVERALKAMQRETPNPDDVMTIELERDEAPTLRGSEPPFA